MDAGGGIRLMLTALFAVLGAWYLADAASTLRHPGEGRGRLALGPTLHVVMSVAMIGMCWPWGTGVPVVAQVTVFTAAAGWFGGQALFGAAGRHGDGTYGNWYHAGMMAVMVWAAVANALMSSPAAGKVGGMSMPGGGVVGMDGMSGMDMAGMDMGGPGTATAAGLPGGLDMAGRGWPGTVCLAVAAVLFAAAAWRAVGALRPLAAAPGQGRAPAPLWHDRAGVVLRNGVGALAAAGMAVVLLSMA